MFKRKVSKAYYMAGVAFTIGTMYSPLAFAGPNMKTGFNAVGKQITEGVAGVPALISAMSYLVGTLLAALGAMKIKDHVENPTQTPLKDGAIRLLIGGFLFALPTVIAAMQSTAATDQTFDLKASQIQAVQFGTAP